MTAFFACKNKSFVFIMVLLSNELIMILLHATIWYSVS
ncbi:hypothetical protein X975_19531, partial [Stegodyphus mimosarum]